MSRRVYVLNRGAHDYTTAEKFGEIVYISDGMLGKLATSVMYRMMHEALSDSSPDDYIVISSLATLCAVACAEFAILHGRLNLLIFHNGNYVFRHINFRKDSK